MASELYQRLAKRLSLTPTALVPPAFACLFQAFRYLLLYGGRGGAKSWSIARALLVQGLDTCLRILVCRETMTSIQASAWQLFKDQIELLGLGDHYVAQADRIVGRNGTEIFFEGLSGNAQKIRSYESINVCWIEEAQGISELSWEVLRPTMRAPGSRIIVSWNPSTRHDAVMRFVTNPMPRSIIRKVGWEDNPHLSAEAHEERLWLQRVDPDLYRHVWGGEPREVSDALILKGKYVVEPFEVRPEWSGPFFGLDLGYGADPCAATEAYIDDDARVLFVRREFWALHVDVDALQQQLEMAIPGISQQSVQADSSRPETVSFLQRHGIPGANRSTDGPARWMTAFCTCVPSPHRACAGVPAHAGRVSDLQVQDRSEDQPADREADRRQRSRHRFVSLWARPLIRNQQSCTFFSRAALLVKGEPAEPSAVPPGYARRVFVTLAQCDRPGTALAAITWAYSPRHAWALTVLDYELAEVEEALTGAWLMQLLERAHELVEEWGPLANRTIIHVEDRQLFDAFGAVLVTEVVPHDPIYEAGGSPL